MYFCKRKFDCLIWSSVNTATDLYCQKALIVFHWFTERFPQDLGLLRWIFEKFNQAFLCILQQWGLTMFTNNQMKHSKKITPSQQPNIGRFNNAVGCLALSGTGGLELVQDIMKSADYQGVLESNVQLSV